VDILNEGRSGQLVFYEHRGEGAQKGRKITDILRNAPQVFFSSTDKHAIFWKSIAKVTPFSNKGPIHHKDSKIFHLSHQPPLVVMSHDY